MNLSFLFFIYKTLESNTISKNKIAFFIISCAFRQKNNTYLLGLIRNLWSNIIEVPVNTLRNSNPISILIITGIPAMPEVIMSIHQRQCITILVIGRSGNIWIPCTDNPGKTACCIIINQHTGSSINK